MHLSLPTGSRLRILPGVSKHWEYQPFRLCRSAIPSEPLSIRAGGLGLLPEARQVPDWLEYGPILSVPQLFVLPRAAHRLYPLPADSLYLRSPLLAVVLIERALLGFVAALPAASAGFVAAAAELVVVVAGPAA